MLGNSGKKGRRYSRDSINTEERTDKAWKQCLCDETENLRGCHLNIGAGEVPRQSGSSGKELVVFIPVPLVWAGEAKFPKQKAAVLIFPCHTCMKILARALEIVHSTQQFLIIGI